MTSPNPSAFKGSPLSSIASIATHAESLLLEFSSESVPSMELNLLQFISGLITQHIASKQPAQVAQPSVEAQTDISPAAQS